MLAEPGAERLGKIIQELNVAKSDSKKLHGKRNGNAEAAAAARSNDSREDDIPNF